MHRLPDGSLRYSPRDLISYLEGDFAAWCERNYVEQPRSASRAAAHAIALAPDERDEEMDLVARRGLAHEADHLARLRAATPDLVSIQAGTTAREQTQAAMHAGVPIIFQAELHAEHWMGIADFLHRTPGPSTFGNFFYEPRDTKLARTAKPYFLLQLCAYAEMLETMQGRRPAQFGFVFGDGTEKFYDTADFWNYYRRLKRSFESFQHSWIADCHPDPALDRTHGRWSTAAERLLHDVDDLTLVAGINRSQIIRLRDAGIDTVAKLARRQAAINLKMAPATLEHLREQAAMQVATRTSNTIQWSHRPPDAERPRRGLALLPPPSKNDIFFDIEGFPYAPTGLEYLLGVVTVDTGTPVFRDWWAHDDAQEKRAFEQFIDWAYARWVADRESHIYHYASYEKTALCRLMGKYGTREFQVDELLRNNVLVDLYPIVLQGLVIGTPSYSLKHVEHLYMPKRSGEVTSAGGSVVEYQRWIDAGESEDHAQSPILDRIRRYNKVDCESTVGLRDWLLARQAEQNVTWVAPQPPNGGSEDPTAITPAQDLAATLLARADAPEHEGERERVTRLMAGLLEFHRREEKPWWWRYFERMQSSDEDLFDDAECLVGLVRTDTPPTVIKRSVGLEYRYNPDQEFRHKDGDQYAITGTEDITCVIERIIDADAGLIELKVGKGKSLPTTVSLVPSQPVPSKPLRESVLRFATRWAADPNCHTALRDLIERRPPRLAGAESALQPCDVDQLMASAIDAARRLDASTLCIQGPPGTGKTTTAAEMIITLVAAGKRVGIVANSHQVVINLMTRIAQRSSEIDAHPALVKVSGDSTDPLITSGRASHIDSRDAAAEIAKGPLVIGGTAWCFARPELDGTLDYLYIEEAGQFSLANAIAVGASAANLILLGDQMQLAQPTQGSHPGESGLSALEYLLHGHATVPPELGIFLGQSHRMHPDVCALISEAYYDGRLKSAAKTADNRIIGAERTSIGLDAGVRFVPVVHNGCAQDSDEEVDAIAELVASLMGCRVTVKGRAERPMTIDDVLVVAPFNMQVRALKRRLGPAARVGSVDKFQGQEAPVVIVSMCASTLDDAPRGPQFLLSKNRLNVAISRAQALAIVVGSHQLGDVRVRSVEEMR
ncbi:MAG: TM0106 family RecB-like putative nuclease, partial [bacterium]